MATYKVIQDIEAEDKFVGPLTIKQFVFAGITVLCLYIDFLLITKNLWPGIFVFTPPAIIMGFLAFPWGRDQPTEVWLLAKFRFFFKPRKRIWDQSGMKDLVTITVPKHIEKHLTNGLDEQEVQSRLKALANTIDSRGWIIKNVDVNMYQQPSYISAGQSNSDRLIDVSALPQNVPAVDINAADDILDETNPVAHQLEAMIDASTQSYHDQLVERLKQGGDQLPTTPMVSASPLPQPSVAPPILSAAEEQALLKRVRNEKTQAQAAESNLHHLDPVAAVPPAAPQPVVPPPPSAQTQAASPMTAPVDPAILGLAKNDDLDVATIARQAQRQTNLDGADGEVVISLR